MARERRLEFGAIADLYDEVRPSYPAALADDVIDLAPGRHALEVGAGTGKATALFAERGVHVHAVEPSAEMAAIARGTLTRYDVTIDVADFEDWEPRGETFSFVYAAQAWHWIDPARGYAKALEVLEPGGLLAAFWNRPNWTANPLRDEVDAVYRRVVPERTPDDPMHPAATSEPDMWGEWQLAIAAQPGLGEPELRSYGWSGEYKTSEYLALLSTHSPNIVLPRAQREALLDGIGHVIDAHGGRLRLEYIAWLHLARAD